MKKVKYNTFLRKAALCAAFLVTVLSMKGQVSFGEATKFNDGWLFTLEDIEEAKQPEYADSTWRQLNLPHDWSIEGNYSPDVASGTGYLPGGIGWYRKHFDYTPEKGKKAYIYFEGIYNRSDVYLNGHHLGHRPSGYNSFMYDLIPYLKEGENVISVKADHSRYADSRYYTGSGIYRDVYFVEAPDSHIAQWGVGFETESVKNGVADVKVNVAIENPLKGMTVKTELINPEGKTVATASVKASAENTLTMKVKDAKLWSVDNPNLYTLRTQLIEKGKRIDGSDIEVGIRTLDFDPDTGFALNGINMKVKGVCIHHDAGALGAVVPEEVWERRLRNLKDMGANALRMSHNPQAPIVYDLADRLGLLIMDEASDEWEFPKRKWIKGWNVGEPGFDGTWDYFEEWIDRDVADMVRRDRNHPSVFLWSIGNEVDYPNDPYSHPILDQIETSGFTQTNYGGYNPEAPDAMRIGEIAKRLNAVVKSVDTSRPTTGALAGVIMSNETAYPEAVDIVGYNYTEDRYDMDHAKYPDRVIYGSENRSDYKAWKDVRDRDFIFGQFIWTGLDYLGESGRWPSRGLNTGLLDFKGDLKPRGQFRKALWSDKPFTYIGTHQYNSQGPMRRFARWLSTDAPDNWNYNEGDTIRVLCYTNAPEARLMLNGKQVGEVKKFDDETGIIHWEIPYSPGTLVAEGLNSKGEIESSYTIHTSGRPYALKISSDKDEFTKPGEVAHLFIEVVDENGLPVKMADNEVTVRIHGDAKLLALESGDNTDMGNYRDNRQRVHGGKLLGYLKYHNDDPKPKNQRQMNFDFLQQNHAPENGKILVEVTSPYLKPATLTIK